MQVSGCQEVLTPVNDVFLMLLIVKDREPVSLTKVGDLS